MTNEELKEKILAAIEGTERLKKEARKNPWNKVSAAVEEDIAQADGQLRALRAVREALDGNSLSLDILGKCL
jgi:hypothetical protein